MNRVGAGSRAAERRSAQIGENHQQSGRDWWFQSRHRARGPRQKCCPIRPSPWARPYAAQGKSLALRDPPWDRRADQCELAAASWSTNRCNHQFSCRSKRLSTSLSS